MARKVIVKVVLSNEQKEILKRISEWLGTSESETMRMTLMNYAKDLHLIADAVQRGTKNTEG